MGRMVHEMRIYAVRSDTKDGEPTMKNADMPAYPSGEAYKSQSIPGGDWVECKKGALHNGLTKREMFAMAAMQGILTRSANTDRSSIASYSVEYADALLAELERTK